MSWLRKSSTVSTALPRQQDVRYDWWTHCWYMYRWTIFRSSKDVTTADNGMYNLMCMILWSTFNVFEDGEIYPFLYNICCYFGIQLPEAFRVQASCSIVTTRPFSERNNLVNKRCRNRADYFSIIRCHVIKLVTDSDEKMAALCVCCGESKSKFYSFTSKKCALYNQAIHNRNYTRSNFRRTI